MLKTPSPCQAPVRTMAAPIMGDDAPWYLNTIAAAVDKPQRANQLVAELTGRPAQSVADWARQNAALFGVD